MKLIQSDRFRELLVAVSVMSYTSMVYTYMIGVYNQVEMSWLGSGILFNLYFNASNLVQIQALIGTVVLIGYLYLTFRGDDQ